MLTDTQIRRSSPGERDYRLTDGRGLYMTVTPSGGRLWRYKYRFNGREKLMSLGQYPDVALVDARERHAAARKLLAAGDDPMERRKAAKAASASAEAGSFETIALEWWTHWKKNKSARHAESVKSRLETDVFPTLGARTIGEIEAPELVAIIKAIERRGALDVAKRSLQTTGQIFRYAIAHSHCRRNPASDIKPGDVLTPTKSVNFARVEEKDLPELLRAIDGYRGIVTRLAMQLMVLTFPRTSELINGEWTEVDFDAARWVIPAARMKMGTPHIIPLAHQAIEILKVLHHITGNGDLMFPGDIDPKKPMSNNTILLALYRMGYKGTMTGHGFRGVASTLLNEHGFEEEHVDLQLAHMKRNKVSAAYNHAKYLKQRTEIMQWWADYIDMQRAKAVPAS